MLWFFLVCVSSRQLKHKQSNFTCCQGKSQRKVLRRDSNTVQTRYEVKLSTNPNRTKCPRPHPLPAKPPYQKPGRRRFAMSSNHPDTFPTTCPAAPAGKELTPRDSSAPCMVRPTEHRWNVILTTWLRIPPGCHLISNDVRTTCWRLSTRPFAVYRATRILSFLLYNRYKPL